MTEIGMTDSDGSKHSLASNHNGSITFLDSGSSATMLPSVVADAIYSKFNAIYNETHGVAVVDCDEANSGKEISFTFGAPEYTISVPANELVIDAGAQGLLPNGQRACAFGVSKMPEKTHGSILGDTFLRSAYVVYDLSNKRVSMAQTRFNATASNVVEIQAGPEPLTQTGVPVTPTDLGGIGGGNPDITATGTFGEATDKGQAAPSRKKSDAASVTGRFPVMVVASAVAFGFMLIL
jgi:hypothetical protein